MQQCGQELSKIITCESGSYRSTLEASQSASPSATTLGVNVKDEAKAATGAERPIEIPASFTDYSSTPTAKVAETVINLEGGVAENETIVIRDEYDAGNVSHITTYPGVILVSATNATASNFDFQTPLATVYLNGTKIKDATAQTAENTFVINADSEISGILTVKKGNVDVYGKVNSIVRYAENPDDTTYVELYDGAVWTNWASEKTTAKITPIVNLGTYTFDPTGYNVAGSSVTDNGDGTWTVAVTNEWKYYATESFSKKEGTTITIMNAAELALLSKEYATYKDYDVVLGVNIDLSGHDWTPIASFCGEFDGNGKTITGMTVTGSNDYVGLFGSTDGSELVKDLTISGATISGKDFVGVVAGSAGYTRTFSNIVVRNSTVNGTGQYTAGIAGASDITFDDCKVQDCTISGHDQVGGMVGYFWAGAIIRNCEVSGSTITSDSERAGGIVGKMNSASGDSGSGYLINNNSVSNTSVTAPDMAGGIAGQIMGDQAAYQIKNNEIDATLSAAKTSPIAVLRAEQSTSFTSKLAENITDNTWTATTLDADTYTYTAAETGAGDQVIWNGSTPDPVAKIGTTEYVTLDAAIKAAIANNDGVAVELIRDITYKPGASWTPINIGFYLDTRSLVVDGNNHTITNLPNMMFKGQAGCFNLSISNLNFEKPTATDDTYAAVICGDGNTSGTLYFSNVNINKASVTSGDYAGAFIGYNATHGDGGSVAFNNCSVTNSTISGSGSTGALMGHATGNGIGKITVTGTIITGNDISCTESGKNNKAGSLFGTVGIAGENVYVSATVSGNTVISDGTAITTIYGRKGSTGEGTGNLYLTEGGSYADKPIADGDASWAMCDDGCVLKQVDNVWTVAKVDGVACVGGVYYKTLDAACAAVNADTPMTWVASSAWASDKVAYYGGTFYATLSAALDAANTANSAETALIYLRPAMTGIAVNQSQYGGHDQIKTSITIFGNDAHLASKWQPCVDYISEQYDAGGHILTKDITYSIYNLHDGASAWGARGSTYNLNVIAKHCTNMSQVYVSVGTENGPTNFTVEDCTFKYQPKGGDNRGYECPITTNQQGSVTVKGCTFTDFDDNYVFNINNKKGGSITVNAENLTFDNCGSSSKQAFRLMGEAEGTTIGATLKSITFSNNSGKIGDIVLGKKDAGENKCAVTYTISGTAGTMQVYTQNTATETVINLDSAQNYSGDNKPAE